jgi:hypothetical protein
LLEGALTQIVVERRARRNVSTRLRQQNTEITEQLR